MQQINLYLPEFRPNREPLRAIHMLAGALVLLILLAGVSVRAHLQVQQLQEQIAQEQKSQEAMQAQLKVLSAQRPAQAGADLDQKMVQLQNSVQRYQQILQSIANQDLGNDKGFSAQLSTLANASLKTISLEQFRLLRGGKYLELQGLTSSVDQVPLYLQQLRAEASFVNVGIGVLSVARDEQQPHLFRFSLSNPKDQKVASSKGGQP